MTIKMNIERYENGTSKRSFEYKDYQIIIHRNKRHDCSIEVIKIRNLKSYERPNMLIGNNIFFTIKAATKKAINAVDYFSQFD